MPFLAILESDLNSMLRSWVVRIWAILLALLNVVVVATALNGEEIPSQSLANLFGTFPLIWSIPVIIVSSGAVSAEAGVLADSILSKAITRYEYIVAKVCARLVTVLGLYLLAVLPPAYIISRNDVSDLDFGGVIWGVLTIGMFLLLLTNLAVAFSAIFNRTLVAVIVVWVLWVGAGVIFSLIESEFLSPVIIIDNLPGVLQGAYKTGDQLRILLGFGLPATVVVLGAVWHFGRKDV